MLKKIEKKNKLIKDMSKVEVVNPSNFIFYVYSDGVKRVFKYLDKDKKSYEEINQYINQYKMYEIKYKSAKSLDLNNQDNYKTLLEISRYKKQKFESLMKKIKEHQKLNNVMLSEYKIIEPKVAVDLRILLLHKEKFKIPLIERKNEPFGYAFPGGFIDDGETPLEATLREAKEEINFEVKNLDKSQISAAHYYDGIDVKNNFLSQNGVRDPRSEGKGKVSTYLYTIKLNKEESKKVVHNLTAKSDAKSVKLCDFDDIVEILKNGNFAQGHGELLIKTIMTIPELLVQYNQKKYLFNNNRKLKEIITKYENSQKKDIIFDIDDRIIVPNL